jgi:uncharacterized membrane protein required for colicin V production
LIQVATRNEPILSKRQTIFGEEMATARESTNNTSCRERTARGPTMGFDLSLGVIILIAAVRGWFQGFVSQAVRLGGLVACVYLAEPVRDYAKPHVLPYLPSIQPELVDRLLWWVSAAATYVALVGVVSLVIKMTRRPEIPGISPSGRNDQFAGFLLGAAKGALIATFATAGIERYALEQIKTITWADEQVKNSWALKWSEDYRPVPRIWASPPVRHFVNYVERMGLRKPGEPSQVPAGEESASEIPAVRTVSRPDVPKIATDGGRAGEIPAPSPPFPPAIKTPAERPDADDQAIADLKAELKIQPR